MDERTITAAGSGRVTRVPDEAEVHLGIRLERPTATTARADGAALMERVLAAVEALGIRRGDVRTAHLALGPVYDYEGGRARAIGYQLTNQATVTVRPVDDVAGIVDAAIGAGATTLDGVSFRIADPADARREALTRAVADARDRAEALADAAGLRITGVVRITEGGGPDLPPIPVLARMETGDAAATPLAGGTTELDARVTVVFSAAPVASAQP
jgi:uncharacterized protein